MQALLSALLNHGEAFVFTVILAIRLGLPLPATPIVLLAGALAVRSPHPLVLGSHSVHTSRHTLQMGQAEIARIGARMGLSAAVAS